MLGCANDGGELQSGNHVCWIYDSDEEHREILTRFFKEGLERNERLLYLARRFTVENVTAYLEDTGIEVKDALRSGQLMVMDAETAYLGKDGFQPERLADASCQVAMQAVVDGYRGLRAASETGWLVPDVVSPTRLLEYEFRVDEAVSSLPQIGLCGYDARSVDADYHLLRQRGERQQCPVPSPAGTGAAVLHHRQGDPRSYGQGDQVRTRHRRRHGLKVFRKAGIKTRPAAEEADRKIGSVDPIENSLRSEFRSLAADLYLRVIPPVTVRSYSKPWPQGSRGDGPAQPLPRPLRCGGLGTRHGSPR